MSTNKFNNHARKEISGHETPLNTEALWDNVQAELYPKRKKKFAWIWFSASTILFAILLVGYFYNQEDKGSSELTEAKITTTNKTEKIKNIEIENTKEKNLNKENASQTNTPAINSSFANNQTSIKPELKNTKKEYTAKSNQAPTQLSAPKLTHTIPEPTQLRKSNNHSFPNEKVNANSQSKIEEINSEKEEKKLLDINQDVDKIIANKNTRNKDTQTEKEKEIATVTKEEKDNVVKKEQDIDLAKPTLDNNPKEFPITDNTNPENAEEDGKEENNSEQGKGEDEGNDGEIKNKIKKNFRLGLGFRAGISNSITNLSSNENGGDNFQRNLRNESENNLETIDLGIDLLLKHKSGVYLSTGIDYIRSTRKLEYNIDKITTDSVMGISAIFVNPVTMDSTFQEGLVQRTSSDFRNKETYNHIHMVNIPVRLGASLNHDQWSFGIEGGVLFNIALQQKGEILIDENTFYDLKVDSERWFQDKLDLSYQGTVLVGYRFTDHFQIVGGPSFRSKLIINTDANPVQQTQTGFGLQVAARYWW